MKLLRWIDDRLLALTVWTVEWLDEWLSVSQKRLEMTVIVVYAVGRAALLIGRVSGQSEEPLWLLGAFSVYFVSWMYGARKQNIHHVMRGNGTGICMRLMFLFLLLAGLPALVIRFDFFDSGASLSDWALAWFLYLLSVPSDSQSGRRRKMALAKLRELFGPLWVPQPIEAS